MSTDLAGASPKMNEFESASYYPSTGCGLEGISLNQTNHMPILAGHFQTLTGGGNWPSGSSPRSFWLMGTSQYGESECSISGATQVIPSNAVNGFIFAFPPTMPAPIASPLTPSYVDHTQTPQCTWTKRANDSSLDLKDEVQAYFLGSQQQIVLEIPGEVKGEGQVDVLDVHGRVLITKSTQAGTQEIDASMLSAGIYLVRTVQDGLPVSVKKLRVK